MSSRIAWRIAMNQHIMWTNRRHYDCWRNVNLDEESPIVWSCHWKWGTTHSYNWRKNHVWRSSGWRL
jgi:hypothetical protein